MIKTEFFDDNHNTVTEKAEIIVQSIFDDKGNLQKKIEWTPKKKTGYLRNSNQIKDEVKYEFLSHDVKNHYLDNVSGIQKATNLLWRHHGQEESITQKRKILSSILYGYNKINFATTSFDHGLKREKGGNGC